MASLKRRATSCGLELRFLGLQQCLEVMQSEIGQRIEIVVEDFVDDTVGASIAEQRDCVLVPDAFGSFGRKGLDGPACDHHLSGQFG